MGDSSFPGLGISVAVSPDRDKVAVTNSTSTTVLDTRTRDVIDVIELPPPDPSSTGDDGEPLPRLVFCSTWLPDGSRLLLGAAPAEDGKGSGIVVVDAATWKPEKTVAIDGIFPRTMEISPDGQLLAVGDALGPKVYLLDVATLEVVHKMSLGSGDYANDVSFSADGERLAVGGELGILYVFDTQTGQRAQAPAKIHDESLLQAEWMPDGRTVATAGNDAKTSLYDVTRGLVRGRPLPASSDALGNTYLVPGTRGELIVLQGDRPGRRYPMRPAAWLKEACAIAGRNLTRTEWSRYLPDRRYERTCTNRS